MTLTDTVKRAVDVAFTAAGDLVKDVTWRRQTFGEYDPVTGTRETSQSDTTVRAVQDEITASEYKSMGLSQKAVHVLIPQIDFERAGAVDPAFDDKLIFNRTTYTAKSVKYEGAKAVWDIFADV